MTDREPRPGDPIYLSGDRRTVLAVRDGKVLAHDDAGFAISRPRADLSWDGYAWVTRRLNEMRCPVCGHRMDDMGGCDSCTADREAFEREEGEVA